MFREYELDVSRSLRATEFASHVSSRLRTVLTDNDLEEMIGIAEQLIEDAMPGSDRRSWEAWLASARYVECERRLTRALSIATGVADAKAAREIRLDELAKCVAQIGQDPIVQANARAQELMSLPLPNLYWHVDHSWDEFRERRARSIDESLSSQDGDMSLPEVVKLAVFIDEFPIVTPQEIRPATMYQLTMRYRLSSLPKTLQGVRFDFLSTLSRDQYSISDCICVFDNSRTPSEKTCEAKCTLSFPFEQSDPFQKTVFAVSAFLLLTDGQRPVRVIGHDQLQFRVRSDQPALLSSGFRRMDAHVQDLLQKLVAQQPAIRDEVKVLVPLLDSLVAVQSMFAQGGVFKSENVSEAEFQAETLKYLRVRLGDDVQEGPRQAGGITDIRFRGVIVELKVEHALTDRTQIALKYGKQPTQYSGVEARSLAIVLCLDLSEKQKPPGDLRNDVVLRQIATNDPNPSHPSWVMLFVVPGNLRSPSDYSR